MNFSSKINLHQIVLILFLAGISAIAGADEITCGIANANNEPKLAVVSADKVYFYRMVFGELKSDGRTTHLIKESVESKRGAYLGEGDEVVVKESPAGYTEYDDQCFVSYIDRDGISSSGFIDKHSLKTLPAPKKAATSDTWSEKVFFVGRDRLTRLEISKNSAQYQIVYGGGHDGGVMKFDFNILSHSFTKLHLLENAVGSQCHLVLWRLSQYLYVEAENCGGRGYSFERLLRQEE